MRFSIALSAGAVLMSMSIAAHAIPLIYTESGIASGTIGGTIFTNVLVTFTEVANGSNITSPGPNTYLNRGGVSTVTIAGIGTVSLLNSSFGAVSQEFSPTFEGVGFYDSSDGFSFVTESPLLVGYDLTTPAGPDTGLLEVNGTQTTSTSLGALSITTASGTSSGTFNAIPGTPEPGSFSLLGTGLLGVAEVVRRRRSRRVSVTG